MSAGSRNKHSRAHKGFQAGSDQLEVSSLIAGAGNGRDVEERLGAGFPKAEEAPSLEQLAQAAAQPTGDTSQQEEALGVGNEGPVTAGNADTPAQQVDQWSGRLAQAILSPEALDAVVPNKYQRGRHVITIVSRDVKSDLFSQDFAKTVKHLLEIAPESITGLSTGFYEAPGGHLMDNTVSPVINVTERHGRVFDNALTEWARRYNDYRSNKNKSVPVSQRAAMIQEEDVTINLFFIEPDETGTKVMAAWSGRNVYPASYPGIESLRNIHGTIREHHMSIGLGGSFTRSEAVTEAAQKAFDELLARTAIEPSTAS